MLSILSSQLFGGYFSHFPLNSFAWYQIAAAVESTQDVLVAFKLSDGMYMQALIKEDRI
jgi:hypothetical protein